MMWTIKWNPWSASSNSPALSLYLLLYFILEGFLILSSGAFTVFGPLVQPTLAWVREDVLLSCHLSPRMDARGMTVKWVRGPLVVHLYHKGKEMKEPQAPAFQGRTEMLRQDMEEGKVTVKMHQVRFSDAGQYTCLFKSGTFYNETSFDLHVAERPFSVIGPAQPFQAKQGEDAILSCKLSPKMDAQNMTVKWFRNHTLVHGYPNGGKLEESQGDEFQGRTELLKHDLTEGKVTLRIQQVQVSNSGPYICHVQLADYYDEANTELQVEEILSTFLRIHLVIAIPSGLSVLVIGFVLSILYKIYGLGARAPACKNSQLQEEDREAAGSSLSLPETSSKDCRRFSTHFQPPASKIMKFYSKKSTEDSEVLESLTST
ncbi:butyrophilin-like protein 2 isoform X2 [Macrotis lagotis]